MNLLDISHITGMTQDSRAVKPGYLFAALPGTKVDGRDFIHQAVNAGASVILAPLMTTLPTGTPENVRLITDVNPKRLLAKLAAQYYGMQPSYSVAVTGTNGKTSTVYFAQQIWAALGLKSAGVGTLGVKVSGADMIFEKLGSMTTPDPIALHRDLATISRAGIDHMAMEASSHGLDQYRLDGVRIRAAGFTSFSRDHLDYHKTDEAYLLAKIRLFSEICEPGGVAVINADIPQYDVLAETAQAHDLKVWGYGHHAYDFQIVALDSVAEGMKLRLRVLGERYEVTLPLAGMFQAYNALCALGLVLAEGGVDMRAAVMALENLHSVPGRLESVSGHPDGAGVYIDYAHTPDAIETVLKALRPHTSGKLVCVFGCGGDRDSGKRPLMGKAAIENADIAIVTDDNPRSEDPASIRAQAAAASPDILNIEGRRAAIAQALSMLGKGDVLVITGKGHEQGQEFADHTEDFCDVRETQKIIKLMSSE
jgi:UDP-N-acetylmuramoyl-L-alanyl-D-glutamate--2,6-diaminopimelate ligase